MSQLQPGSADVVLEVKFDKLAPATLRSAVATDCTAVVDQLVAPVVRDTWLNKPYTHGGDPYYLLDHVEKLLSVANPSLSVTPTEPMNFYCWIGGQIQCYSPFEVHENGSPVVITVEDNGLRVDCRLVAVMAIVV